ncbi:MAG: hypothetical protein ACP5GX_06505 [Anaerolineae bacterium]
MQNLPIKHVILYKHGVGFFERRGELSGEDATLIFRREEMNDVLKSLTIVDEGEGQVLGVDYATPQTREERLSGCSVHLADDRSFSDLIVSLRGRVVRLVLDQGEEAVGTLLGLDDVSEKQSPGSALVSVLLEGSDEVRKVMLERVQGVEILDGEGVGDLRFFLKTALTPEEYRRVHVRLTPGNHYLSVRYIAPAPTWRVSYRLVTQPPAEGAEGEALLQGWGIFDNQLDEDLEDISLSLVAGMPISFVYDLYTPFTPERPVIEEEERVAPGPVSFGAATAPFMEAEGAPPPGAMRAAAMRAPAPAAPVSRGMKRSTAVATEGKSLGELFQYRIQTPVTVGRGQSAMVPILSANPGYRKDLLYNGTKLPVHPVATLRFKNESGLTLERGPVTVIAGSEYVGEAILPFTVAGGEVVVPHAVELGIKVHEENHASREMRELQIQGAYLLIEEWDIRTRVYRIANSTGENREVLVEHPRNTAYHLFDTPEPRERADEHLRFAIEVPARSETHLQVRERRLVRRKEELQRQSLDGLRRYLQQGLLDRATLDRVAKLLLLWDTITDYRKEIAEVAEERGKIYQAQQQIQGNMGALSQTGKEGALRARYVEQLASTEERLKTLDRREQDLKAEIERVEREIESRIEGLGGGG